MKSVAITCAMLMLFAATAAAGDLAVSKSTLGDMGLAGMQQMSDEDGLAVRGKGVAAAVWGGSTAKWAQVGYDAYGKPHFGPISSSNNNYEAAASWLGPVGASAAGGSLSFAGQIEVLFAADPTGFALQVQAAAAIAGGGAFATAM